MARPAASPPETSPNMASATSNTDEAWEEWGAKDPYYGVLTNPIFRRVALTEASKDEFFRSGQTHVKEVLAACREEIDPAFVAASVLDFGCGVGRLTAAFAETAARVIGVDVSKSMLAEARRNLDERAIRNVELRQSDDELSEVPELFDLVHSAIVLQHIETHRGRALFHQLVQRIRPGGIGALHVTFGLSFEVATFGQPKIEEPPPPVPPTLVQRIRIEFRRGLERLHLRAPPPVEPPLPNPDPVMLMNYYNLSELFFILHRAGISQVHTKITDHGGALGAFLYFRRP